MKTHYQAPNSLYTYCLRYLGNTCGQFAGRPLRVSNTIRGTTCKRCRAAYARYQRRAAELTSTPMVIRVGSTYHR